MVLSYLRYVVTKRIDVRRSKQQQLQKNVRKRRGPKTAYSRLPQHLQNGSVNDESWEENSEYSVQDNEEETVHMNGSANHSIETKAD